MRHAGADLSCLGEAEWGAHLVADGLGHLVATCLEASQNIADDCLALVGCRLGPRGKRCPGGFGRTIYIFCRAEANGRESLFGGGIDHIQRLATGWLDPFAVDIEFGMGRRHG